MRVQLVEPQCSLTSGPLGKTGRSYSGEHHMCHAHLADGALRDAANDFGKIFESAKPALQVVPFEKGCFGENAQRE